MSEVYFLDLGLANPETSEDDAAAFLMANRGRESVFDGYLLAAVDNKFFLIEKEKLVDFVKEIGGKGGLEIHGRRKRP